MSTDTDVNQLIINTLTSSQFESIQTPSNIELYYVTDDDVYATKAYVDSVIGEIETALAEV